MFSGVTLTLVENHSDERIHLRVQTRYETLFVGDLAAGKRGWSLGRVSGDTDVSVECSGTDHRPRNLSGGYLMKEAQRVTVRIQTCEKIDVEHQWPFGPPLTFPVKPTKKAGP